jgi:phytol kinase
MTNNFIGLAISYLYAISLLLLGESLHKIFGVKQEITRKIIHVGGGMWVFGVIYFFNNWQVGIVPFATFIGVNYLLYRYRFIQAMDSQDSSPGTIYFAISITLLFALLWRPDGSVDNAPIAVAGTMAMTWGDALAALVGRRFGKHQYQIGNSVRSWEGSAVMLLASTTAVFLVLLFLPGSALAPLAIPVSLNRAIFLAISSCICATLAEAVSPHGTDNLSVPLVTSGVIWLLISSMFE